MNNNKLLILLLSFLVIIKFIIFPILDWQNELIAETTQLEKKINKSEAYINDLPKLIEQQETLKNILIKSKSNIETYHDIGRYKINKQREIEQMFRENNVNIKTLNWREDMKTINGFSLKLQLQYSGRVKDFIALKLAILSLGQSVNLRVFGINISIQGNKSLGFANGNMEIIFSPMESGNAAV